MRRERNECRRASYASRRLFVQVVQQDVAQGDHAHHLPMMADGQMAEVVQAHQGQATVEILIHSNGKWIVGHDLSHAGGARVEPFGHHAFHKVALGKNAHQLVVMHHRDCANVAFNHDVHRFQHGLAEVCQISFLDS